MKNFYCLMMSVVFVVVLVASPVRADDPFIDLISSTKIYFSHVAVGGPDGWNTEIAVLNPNDSATSGVLTPYDSKEGQVSQAVSIDLPAHGRYQADVRTAFSAAENIAYVIFTSESFGLKGYSKFYTSTVRASIIASSPKTSGMFTKIDHQGWTGIAFINTATVSANITLTAYSDAGVAVAVEHLPAVGPGEKIVDTAERLFTQSVANASYISYSSDQGVVGFFLNGSNGNTLLDGSQAL